MDDDTGDVLTITNDLDDTVRNVYPNDSPQMIFWEQQKSYNSLNNKRQMRWHPLVLRFSLNLSVCPLQHTKQLDKAVSYPFPLSAHSQTTHTGVRHTVVFSTSLLSCS